MPDVDDVETCFAACGHEASDVGFILRIASVWTPVSWMSKSSLIVHKQEGGGRNCRYFGHKYSVSTMVGFKLLSVLTFLPRFPCVVGP